MEKIKFDRMKNWANIQKHGMSLFTAANVLHNPNALIDYDEIHNTEEERLHLIGEVDGRIVFLVYTIIGIL